MRGLAVLLLLAPSLWAGELFNKRVAAIEPFPREIGRGKEVVIKGLVKGGFRTPELIIIAPGGRTFLNKDNVIRDSQFTFTVAFEDGVGPYRMEVIARKRTSIKSAARFTIWHGARARKIELPPVEGAPTPVTIHPRLIEKRFLHRLNAFRKSIKEKPVGWNEAVAARAREHAVRMAKAERRQHRFGRAGGVKEMLRRDGAGPTGASGPNRPWGGVNARRPFRRPALKPFAPDVENRVVTFVLADTSLEAMFEKHFVREAAFRICAADPYCLEVGVGVARTPPAKKGQRQNPLVYYCICFVQVNDLGLKRDQDAHHRALLKEAARRNPIHVRRLGIWGRGGRAEQLCKRVLTDKRFNVAGGGFDALLLLDEEWARKHEAKTWAKHEQLFERGKYAAAIAAIAPFGRSHYDAKLAALAQRTERDVLLHARAELGAATKLPDDERRKKLKDLLTRVKGLSVEERVAAELAKLEG